MKLMEEMKLAQTGILLVKQFSSDLKAARRDGHVTLAEGFRILVRAGETVLSADPEVGSLHLFTSTKGATNPEANST